MRQSSGIQLSLPSLPQSSPELDATCYTLLQPEYSISLQLVSEIFSIACENSTNPFLVFHYFRFDFFQTITSLVITFRHFCLPFALNLAPLLVASQNHLKTKLFRGCDACHVISLTLFAEQVQFSFLAVNDCACASRAPMPGMWAMRVFLWWTNVWCSVVKFMHPNVVLLLLLLLVGCLCCCCTCWHRFTFQWMKSCPQSNTLP